VETAKIGAVVVEEQLMHMLMTSGKTKTTPPPGGGGGGGFGVSMGARVTTPCNWLSKLFKNLKLDFLI
jgi:hypothetical protein